MAKRLCSGARKGRCRWVYTEYETGERELYDISKGPCYEWRPRKTGDPCMLVNKAGKPRYAKVEQALRTELSRLWR